jgi:glutathione S-transferase
MTPPPLALHLANKNYSSWSLRAWLPLKQAGLDFEEAVIPLDRPETRDAVLRHSPSGRLPCLWHGAVHVWDSLAIGEYLAETFPASRLWPEDRIARARARSLCAEMHAGFAALRSELPMNVRAVGRKVTPTEQARADIARIVQIWTTTRAEHGAHGPFLFGDFTLADAFYVPVASRFRTYGVPLEGAARAWADHVLGLPAMREYAAAAKTETWIIQADEAG